MRGVKKIRRPELLDWSRPGAERAVDLWNKEHPAGTAVVVTKDDGAEVHTRTRSEAWVMPAGHPVVLLEGVSGGYALERVRPAAEVAAC